MGEGARLSDRSKPTDLSDISFADAFIRDHGADVIHSAGHFYLWDERRWKRDDANEILALAESTCLSIHQSAMRADGQERKNLLGLSRSHSSATRMASALKLVASHIAVDPAKLDACPFFLNCLTGTIDLRTGVVLAHDQAHLITKLAPVEYDCAHPGRRWRQFLKEIFTGDMDLVDYIQAAAGYSFTADQREQAFFFLHGGGSNGKSLFLEILKAVGGDYAQTAPSQLLLTQRNNGATPEIARLQGARFVASSETSERAKLNEERVKALTGEEKTVGRSLYKNIIEFPPSAHYWFASNLKPQITGNDWGIWRRVKLIPFNVKFESLIENPDTAHPKDPKLRGALMEEAPGILNWILDGAREWHEHGLLEPKCVSIATRQYRDEQDILRAFIDESCECAGSVRMKDLFARYREWSSGDREAWSQKKLSTRLEETGYEKRRDAQGIFWIGLSLRS